MNPQRTNMITEQDQKLSIEAEEHLQILEGLKTTITKMRNQDVSIAMFMDIWQRIAKRRKRRKRLGNATNITKWDTQQKDVRQSRK